MNREFFQRAILALSLAAISCAASASAETVAIGDFPFGGGQPFRVECPAGEYMTGLEGRRGAWVDSITPRCSPWDAASRSFGAARALALVGGSGGEQAVAYCSNAPLIPSMYVARTRDTNHFVDGLILHCRDRENIVTSHATFNGNGEDFDGRGEFIRCPVDYVAVGLHGRAGDSIDDIGLLCAPLPPEKAVLTPPSAIGGISKGPAPTKVPTTVPASSDRLGGGSKIGTQRSGTTPPPAQTPAPPAAEKIASQRHDAPTIMSDEGAAERVDYCLNFASECGEAAASAYCAANDPERPVSGEAPLEFGVGRTFTIGDRQLCEQENCSSFEYIVCTAN